MRLKMDVVEDLPVADCQYQWHLEHRPRGCGHLCRHTFHCLRSRARAEHAQRCWHRGMGELASWHQHLSLQQSCCTRCLPPIVAWWRDRPRFCLFSQQEPCYPHWTHLEMRMLSASPTLRYNDKTGSYNSLHPLHTTIIAAIFTWD